MKFDVFKEYRYPDDNRPKFFTSITNSNYHPMWYVGTVDTDNYKFVDAAEVLNRDWRALKTRKGHVKEFALISHRLPKNKVVVDELGFILCDSYGGEMWCPYTINNWKDVYIDNSEGYRIILNEYDLLESKNVYIKHHTLHHHEDCTEIGCYLDD